MLLRDPTLFWTKAHPDAAGWDLENCTSGLAPPLVYPTLHVYLYPWNYL